MPPEHTIEERDSEWRNDIYYEVRFIRGDIEKLKSARLELIRRYGQLKRYALLA